MVLTVTFKQSHGFNYSFDNTQLCEHLFKGLNSVPTMEFAVELELCFLPLVLLSKQMEMVLRIYKKSTTYQKHLKGKVISARKREK